MAGISSLAQLGYRTDPQPGDVARDFSFASAASGFDPALLARMGAPELMVREQGGEGQMMQNPAFDEWARAQGMQLGTKWADGDLYHAIADKDGGILGQGVSQGDAFLGPALMTMAPAFFGPGGLSGLNLGASAAVAPEASSVAPFGVDEIASQLGQSFSTPVTTAPFGADEIASQLGQSFSTPPGVPPNIDPFDVRLYRSVAPDVPPGVSTSVAPSAPPVAPSATPVVPDIPPGIDPSDTRFYRPGGPAPLGNMGGEAAVLPGANNMSSTFGSGILNWAKANPIQALQLAAGVGSLFGKGTGSGGGPGGLAGLMKPVTKPVTKPDPLNRTYAAAPAGYRPGVDPEFNHYKRG